MRRLQVLLAGSILAFTAGCEPLPTHLQPPAAAEGSAGSSALAATRSICAGQSVPEGYVVVATGSSGVCATLATAGAPAALTIRPLESPSSICARWKTPAGWVLQPIPAGYVVVGSSHSTACDDFDNPSGYPNEFTIRTLVSPMTICARWPTPFGWVIQPIPAGYVVSSSPSSSACPDYPNQPAGFPNVYTISTPESPMTVCARRPNPGGWQLQAIPAGYVVSSATRSAACPDYSTSIYPNELTIRMAESPMQMCARWPSPLGWVIQPIPAGYVMVGAAGSTSCPDSPTSPSGYPNVYTISTPESLTAICLRRPNPTGWTYQPVPAGYVAVAGARSPSCPDYSPSGAPNQLTIRTPASPMEICARWATGAVWVIQPIPEGYVVASTASSSVCPDVSGYPNVYTIRTPESPMVVCLRRPNPTGWTVQSIPAGYVVVASARSSTCPDNNTSGPPNQLTIRTAASPMAFCARWWTPGGWVIQPLPAGYVVSSTANSPDCPDATGYPNVYTIRTPASPLAICARGRNPTGWTLQAIPAGYVVVSAARSPTCADYSPTGTPNQLTIRATMSGIAICAGWQSPLGWVTQSAPAGYTVVSAANSLACPPNPSSLRNAYTIRQL